MLNRFKTLLDTVRKPTTQESTDDQTNQAEDDDRTLIASARMPSIAPLSEGPPIAPVSSIPLPSVTASRAKLVDCRGSHGLGEFPLTSAVTMISRKNEWGMSNLTPLLIDDPGISRNHAVIELRDSHYWLRDLGSANGTYLNHVAVKEAVLLKHGDQIRFHEYDFSFLCQPG